MKKEQSAAPAAEATEGVKQGTAKAAKAEKSNWEPPKPCVYCGPSVRGVARQYTVYTGGIPEALREFIQKHPAARGLVVGMSKFAETRENLGKRGTAETALYEKIKSEL